jgi:L-asparaginase II
MSATASSNPILVEMTRGPNVESRHAGAIAISDPEGDLLLAIGDVECPIYPRSAVKVMQAIPLVESGAADAFGLDDDELAVVCASHSADAVHLAAVRSLLAKARLDESYLASCAQGGVRNRSTTIAQASTPACSPPRSNLA